MKESPPSSLHHYTSMDALTAMLNQVLKDNKKGNPMLTFHASMGYSMNDKAEGTLFADRIFTDSIGKTKLKEQFDDIKKTEGEIFVVSFSRSKRNSQNTGDVAMWNMYGDSNKGVILVFDYKKLDAYAKGKDLTLIPCEYYKTEDITEVVTAINTSIKGIANIQIHNKLVEILYSTYSKKKWQWDYEGEYRLLLQNKDPLYKTGKYGLTAYSEVKIPLDCLKTIIIGPLAEQEIAEKSLNLIKNKLTQLNKGLNFSITKSNIQIR